MATAIPKLNKVPMKMYSVSFRCFAFLRSQNRKMDLLISFLVPMISPEMMAFMLRIWFNPTVMELK